MAKAQNTGREGESAVAAFDMDVDETATPKQYFLDSEILCEDAEGHDYISDSVKVNTRSCQLKKNMLPGFELGTGVALPPLLPALLC